MKILIVLATFLVFSCASTLKSLDWRVIGGQTAQDGQFPYQVSLKGFGFHSCGGTIINNASTSKLWAIAGTNKLDSGGITLLIQTITYHKNFDFQHVHNDIALLRTATPIPYSEKVQSISLNTKDINAGEDLILSGWGRISYPGNIPNDLQFIHLKSIATSDCIERHVESEYQVDETQICTLTQRGEGACHGDSGGPLVWNGKVAGIVSWGRPCAIGYPDVFTRVSSYINWINDTMIL